MLSDRESEECTNCTLLYSMNEQMEHILLSLDCTVPVVYFALHLLLWCRPVPHALHYR